MQTLVKCGILLVLSGQRMMHYQMKVGQLMEARTRVIIVEVYKCLVVSVISEG